MLNAHDQEHIPQEKPPEPRTLTKEPKKDFSLHKETPDQHRDSRDERLQGSPSIATQPEIIPGGYWVLTHPQNSETRLNLYSCYLPAPSRREKKHAGT